MALQLIILDRDGVINYDSPDYIKSPAEWIPIPGSLEAIAKLNQHGYTVTVATNQSGVGRGLFDLAALQAMHAKMQTLLHAVGGKIDTIFYCPHTPSDHCTCRKPQPGLLIDIAKHYGVSLQGVPFIGDKPSDVQAARAVGCQPILVNYQMEGVPSYTDLAAAVEKLLKHN